MRLTIRGALALLGNTLAWAQPVSLTVEAAVEQALRQQPVREVFAQRVQAGQQLGLQAGLKPNPRLYLQSENTRFWSQPSFSYPGASDNFLYLTQPVESGGKRERRMELAAENVERSRLDAELFDRQLALRVRVAYWTAAGAARSAELVRAQADSFRALVENNRLRARVGIIPEADVLRSEVELQRLVAMQRQAEADARLLIVGKHDARLRRYTQRLRARIEALGVAAHVHLLDDVSEATLKACYLVADALVIPSRHEGFCVPLAEAMALSVPVVARDAGALAETLGDAGLVWHEDDPRLYAASVARLRRDAQARAALTAAGRARYRTHYAPEVLVQRLLALLERPA